MRKRTKIVLGLVVALVVGLGLQPALASRSSAGSTSASASSAPRATSAALSLSTGSAASTSTELVSALGDSITYRPASWFRRYCRSSTNTCLNAGVTGDTTTQMYTRLRSQVLAHDPDVMLLMGGANDIRHGVGTGQIIRRLKRIVAAAEAAGVPVVISTVPPQDLHGAAVLALNRAIRAYAGAAGLRLLDMYRSVGDAHGTYRSGLSDDGLHPNGTGFARMAAVARSRLPALIAAT